MEVTLAIQRYNPETDQEPQVKEYTVTAKPTDRVLDALLDITRNQDGTLGYRRSCAHGVCGSDAMLINGRERLACKTLIKDVIHGPDYKKIDGESAEEIAREDEKPFIMIEPLKHLEVQRDLMVDQSPFFKKFKAVKPYFEPKAAQPEGHEFIQSPEERSLFDEATKCINCAACYSACPILDKNPKFIGPAAIVQAARFINDSRDQGLEARLDILDHNDGVWPCESKFECTRVCPRDIKITKLINQTKRQIKKYREARGESTNEPVKE
ncbi:MAG: succinate dehydrogenase/fumarate reductase iron-sulfur subunit [Alkalispirochaetaceae bacterium]